MAKSKKKNWAENGLEDWGAYMAAKKEKLEDQFQEEAQKEFQDATSLFSGIAIFVNGYTNPCADELKRLMMAHGGVYHHYMRSRITTHIIASNLPYSKIVMYRKSKNPLPICKPEWITDSLAAKKLLDWRPYVLYSNNTITQPQLVFPGESIDSTLMESTERKNDSQENLPQQIATTSDSAVKSDRLSTKNSEFLSEFYNNSRLHHISTMGATFKDYVNELRMKTDSNFPGLDRLKKWREKSREKINGQSDSEEDLFESPPEPRSKETVETVIMHIDMDCFFVSVGLRNRPEMRGLPVAVTHARGNGSSRKIDSNEEDYGSMSEIASCSYEARAKGVKNGMFLGQALKLCPNLKTIQYDFEGYKEVSYGLYDTVASYTLLIEAVSCDEMYADVTNILRQSSIQPLEFATIIRQEIREKTGCPVSTGFGCNKLQARLATRKAKPDGQFFLESRQFRDYIGSMVVRDLPGVGYSTMKVLNQMNVKLCSDLHEISLGVLQKEFGKKTGEMLYNMCRGVDNSKLTIEHVRKSVSAEVNYGIRFESVREAENFLRKLSQEVCDRLQKANAKGTTITLKLMVRAKDAPKETLKFMGHGICDNFTKSKNVIAPVDDPIIITREVLTLFNQMQQPFDDIRGIGIQISRLKSTNKASASTTMMNFIIKSRQSDSVQKSANENVASSNKEETITSKPEVAVNKTRGLEAFLVPKVQLDHENLEDIREKDVEKMETCEKSCVDEQSEQNDGTNFHRRDAPSNSSFQFSEMSNFDETVLKELPEDIRNEIFAMQKSSLSEKRLTSRQTVQDEYFKHVKSSTVKNEKSKIPPIEEIDMAVLIELPEDIRNEIINEYRTIKRKNDAAFENDAEEAQKRETSEDGQMLQEDVSFSQVDPEFLAALTDDVKNDVEMYCLAKKKEKLSKMKKPDPAMSNQTAKNRNSSKLFKKPARFSNSRNKISNDRTNVKKSSEVTKKIDDVKIVENRSSRRLLESEYNGQIEDGSLEQREEIISHHSSFTGKKAKTDEEEKLTGLVNYLFGLPLRQVKMQIQMWISNSDDVNEIDLLSLATFLSMLPKKKRLEDLHILLKTMHRCIDKTGSCVWHETYRRTISHVQHYMKIEYNSKMILPTVECDFCDCEKKKS